jgi:ATP-binding cassette subfamily C protein
MIVTHKVSLLTGADQVLVMRDGTVEAFGPAARILEEVAGLRPVPSLVPPAQPEIAAGRRLADVQRAAG